MTDAQRPRPDGDTEVIPVVRSGKGIPRTAEIPVVDDATVEVPPPVAPPAVAPAPVAQVAPAAAERSPGARVVAPVPPPSVIRPVERPRRRNAVLALLACLVVAVLVGAGLGVLRNRSTTGAPEASRSAAPTSAATALTATVSSLDPSGGSGFRSEGGGTWRTQTYRSADFGNLKSGVGLLLDLGAPRAVSSVTVEVAGGPLALELRAGDERASSEAGYDRVAAEESASGTTTLTAQDGGRHRYWLIFVTRLAPEDGGYRAVLRDPVAKGVSGSR